MNKRTRVEAAQDWFARHVFHWMDGGIVCEHIVDPWSTVFRKAEPDEIVAWANRLVTGSVGEVFKANGMPKWTRAHR